MKVLIKKAHIICSASPFHGQIKDILIIDGTIEKITDNITENADEIIANDNLNVSIGWMDIFAHFADPGYEQKETIETGAAAAAAGGFTDLMILPNTNPSISSKSQVEYIVQRSASLPVNIYPIASITKNAEGKDLAEMYDMNASGAIAFSDGISPVQSPGVLLKALQYVVAIDRVIIQVPDDKSISAHGLVNEGIVSTRLGLPGKPAIAEELMIRRDIEILKYTNSRLHITGISTRKGIEMVEIAKKDGLKLTASVTPYHCFFCDEDLQQYDTNLKVNPPLRTRADMMAVRESLRNGTIDCIASHHIPQHWDDKTCEFEYAKNGMIGLETLFGVVNSFENNIENLVNKLTVVPRQVFKIAIPQIKEGVAACLTLFDKEQKYIFEASMIRSKSQNSPFIGKALKGKVIGIINKNKIVINP
ncbi:MAG: dihydroorotase [Ferruginibacter sp.]